MNNPDVQAAISTAEGAGRSLLEDAYNAASIFVGHIETNFANDLPTVEDKVVQAVSTFVPSAEQAPLATFLNAIKANTESTLDPELVTAVNNALGVAMLRIKGILGTT